jgi:2-keto-4-pentenoate hydratase/2-oxohepta-3-ene-1,7-dioic acid hydratase in catechol pathway
MLNEGSDLVRLLSTTTARGETLGVVADGRWLPARDLLPDGPTMIADLLARGEAGLRSLREAAESSVARIVRDGRALDDTDLLAPVPRPGKVVAIGRNYRAHAAEEGVDPPTAPLIFSKWPSSVVGHGAAIRWSGELTTQVDFEAELAVVIGRAARHVTVDEALDHVLGYTCLNDVSARDLQFGDGQWVRGKSLDTFCPMGPVLVTADEIGDPQGLAISCTVGSERMQEASTAQMYFTVAELISYCSAAFTLEPGDVIATGTPGGVGAFREPPRFLMDGDRVSVEIERIGRLENLCVVEPAPVLA